MSPEKENIFLKDKNIYRMYPFPSELCLPYANLKYEHHIFTHIARAVCLKIRALYKYKQIFSWCLKLSMSFLFSS